jgi:hypothetical protein
VPRLIEAGPLRRYQLFGPEPSAYSSVAWKRKHLQHTRLILLVILYGCETWSLTLREEHRLRVF